MGFWQRLLGRSYDHVDGEMLMRCNTRSCASIVVLFTETGKLPHRCPRCGKSLRVDRDLHRQSRISGQRALSLDGAEMVCVPEGQFLMGSTLSQLEAAFASASAKYMVSWLWFEREFPQHDRSLPGFWIDVVPVTCERYLRFCEATEYKTPEYWKDGRIPAGKEKHPVVQVDWADAVAYCTWAGKRLPYEAEWEKAARGTDGRVWPWGDEFRPDGGNIAKGHHSTEPVGSYPAGVSPYGCLDMSGNVFQWTRDINARGYGEVTGRSLIY